jgi:hypothetical protein
MRPAPVAAQAPAAFAFEEADIASLQKQMAEGSPHQPALTQAYLDRIAAIDDAGPTLNAVIETNPDALKDADALDAERKAGKLRGPLHGIPVLLKDNIDAMPMVNSAGSLALASHKPKTDAFLVAKLRDAGAVILGKTNLSEWANFRSTRSTSGWSGRGGQTHNPYALDRNPCGSSAGTGSAIAANLAAVGIGTETDGSILCPSAVAGPGRPQAHRGAGQPQRHHPDLGLAGHRRPDDAQRGRCRRAADRDRRARRHRCGDREYAAHAPPSTTPPTSRRCTEGCAHRRGAQADGLPAGYRCRVRARDRGDEGSRRDRGRRGDPDLGAMGQGRVRGAAVRIQGWPQSPTSPAAARRTRRWPT